MKWSWSVLETAPCTETQADPQERGLPQQPQARRLLLLSARIYLDLRGRERPREVCSRGWRAKRGRGWARVRERRKSEGRHLNKTRSDWCLHDKGARHLPWLVSQCGTKAMRAPPGRGWCVVHTHVYASKVWYRGGTVGARRQVSRKQVCLS